MRDLFVVILGSICVASCNKGLTCKDLKDNYFFLKSSLKGKKRYS